MAELFFLVGGIEPPIPPVTGGNRVPLFRLEVKIQWTPVTSGYFTLDYTELDRVPPHPKAGILASSVFSVNFDGPNDDVTSMVDKVSTRRGRDDNLQKMSGGTGTIVCSDPEGFFNAANPNSAVAAYVKKPLRPCRIRAFYNDVTYGIFWGWTQRITFEPQGRSGVAQIELIDLFERLKRARPVLESLGATTTGAALGRVLDSIGFTDPAFRSIQTGENIPDFAADGSDDGLKLVEGLVEAAVGVAYIDGNGVFTFKDADYRNDPDVAAEISDGMRAVHPGVDLNLQHSRVTIVRTNMAGEEIGRVSASDANAEVDIGVSDYPEIRSPYFGSDGVAQTAAERILLLVKDPIPPIFDLKIAARTHDLLETIFESDLVKSYSVAETQTGTQGLYLLERAGLDIESRKTLEASWGLSWRPVQSNLFTLDESILDGDDVLGF